MIAYLDTSAVVPLLIREASSASCRQVWDACDDAVTSRLTYVETAAALAQALRAGRMTADQHSAGLELLEAFWTQCDVVDLDQELTGVASSMAHAYGLCGYDAVHCASAAEFRKDPALLAVSGERTLLQAWSAVGLATFDTNAESTGSSR